MSSCCANCDRGLPCGGLGALTPAEQVFEDWLEGRRVGPAPPNPYTPGGTWGQSSAHSRWFVYGGLAVFAVIALKLIRG